MPKEKQDEYRDYALTTMELAKRHPAGPDQNRLLMLAEAWLDLAERTALAAKDQLRRVNSKSPHDAAAPNKLD